MEAPKKTTLFELAGVELDLLNRIEEAIFAEPMDDSILDPGATAEQMVDDHLAKLAEVQGQLGAKLEGYCKAIKAKAARAEMLKAEALLYQAEVTRLAQRARDDASTAEFLEARLKAFLEKRGLKEFETTTHKLKIVNQGGKLPLQLASGVTPKQVPERFHKVIPEQTEFDKSEIEAALKEGEKLELTLPAEGEGEPQTIVWAKYGDRPTKLKIS